MRCVSILAVIAPLGQYLRGGPRAVLSKYELSDSVTFVPVHLICLWRTYRLDRRTCFGTPIDYLTSFCSNIFISITRIHRYILNNLSTISTNS